jgi:MurNAc alpha-1-phosphate uridylyltransferase
MIMAAGLGTRMHPLTLETPKPLIPFHGKPLLDYAIEGLRAHGVQRIVVNTHYLASLVHTYLATHHPDVVISHESDLLETGGGIKAALRHFVGDPIFVVNPDVVYTAGLHRILNDLERAWKPDQMDCLLALCTQEKCHSFFGKGDYDFDEIVMDSRLRGNDKEDGSSKEGEDAHPIKWRGDKEQSAYFVTGTRLIKVAAYAQITETFFSDKKIWDQLESQRRLAGQIIQGEAYDISSVPGLTFAHEHFPHE